MLACLLAAFALGRAWTYGGRHAGEDFYLHWGVALVHGSGAVEDIYSDAGRALVGQRLAELAALPGASPHLQPLAERNAIPRVWATPFLYTVFGLAVSGDYDRDHALYRALALAATALAVLVVGRALHFGTTGSLLTLVLCTEFFEPFRSAQRAGNVSQLQLGVLALYLLLRRGTPGYPRALAAGALLGAALLFKPNLATIVLLLVVQRGLQQGRRALAVELAGISAGALAALALSAATFDGLACWGAWSDHIRAFLAVPPLPERGNYALGPLLGITPPPLLLAALAAPALAVLVRTRRRGSAGSQDDVFAIGAGAALGLLSAPVAWLHYYNLAVPLALFALRPGDAGRDGCWGLVRRVLAAVAVTALALEPLIEPLQIRSAVTFAWLAIGGTLGLLVLVLADRVVGRAAHDPPRSGSA